MPKVQRLEARIRDGVREQRISVRIVAPPEGTRVRGSVFVPPLIGGSGLQQVGYFRELERRGYRLVTFDYRGHGKSGGRFRIAHSLADARAVLALVREELGEPLFGLADCYGCIPLLVAAAERPDAFRALALFNPIPSLQHVATPREVLANYFLPRNETGAPRLALRNPFDLRGMLLALNTRLFPDVDKSRDHFGILAYARADTWTTTWEYLVSRPLTGVSSTLPAAIWFGRSDRLLRLADPAAEQRYRALWRAHLPNGTVHVLDEADHYWTGIRPKASALAAAFFESVAPQREPGDASERNHQLGGATTSSGLKAFAGR